MKNAKEYLIIGILWLAGAFLLGHSFIPHHHHHSEESAASCSHHSTDEHQHASVYTHEHDSNEAEECPSHDECDECHLEGDFYLSYAKVLPTANFNGQDKPFFIPTKLSDAKASEFIYINHYVCNCFWHSSLRGPPVQTSLPV